MTTETDEIRANEPLVTANQNGPCLPLAVWKAGFRVLRSSEVHANLCESQRPHCMKADGLDGHEFHGCKLTLIRGFDSANGIKPLDPNVPTMRLPKDGSRVNKDCPYLTERILIAGGSRPTTGCPICDAEKGCVRASSRPSTYGCALRQSWGGYTYLRKLPCLTAQTSTLIYARRTVRSTG